jgi:hypothetical protein
LKEEGLAAVFLILSLKAGEDHPHTSQSLFRFLQAPPVVSRFLFIRLFDLPLQAGNSSLLDSIPVHQVFPPTPELMLDLSENPCDFLGESLVSEGKFFQPFDGFSINPLFHGSVPLREAIEGCLSPRPGVYPASVSVTEVFLQFLRLPVEVSDIRFGPLQEGFYLIHRCSKCFSESVIFFVIPMVVQSVKAGH